MDRMGINLMPTQANNGRDDIERFREQTRWETWKALGTILALAVAMWGVIQLLIRPQVRQVIEHLSVVTLAGIVVGSLLFIVLLNVGIPLYLRTRREKSSLHR